MKKLFLILSKKVVAKKSYVFCTLLFEPMTVVFRRQTYCERLNSSVALMDSFIQLELQIWCPTISQTTDKELDERAPSPSPRVTRVFRRSNQLWMTDKTSRGWTQFFLNNPLGIGQGTAPWRDMPITLARVFQIRVLLTVLTRANGSIVRLRDRVGAHWGDH